MEEGGGDNTQCVYVCVCGVIFEFLDCETKYRTRKRFKIITERFTSSHHRCSPVYGCKFNKKLAPILLHFRADRWNKRRIEVLYPKKYERT
jgi:hypothetical protein